MAMLAFQQRLLNRSIEIAGGMRLLCARLGVPEHAVHLWLQGQAQIPDRVFLAAADLVLEDDIARAAQDRRHIPRAA